MNMLVLYRLHAYCAGYCLWKADGKNGSSSRTLRCVARHTWFNRSAACALGCLCRTKQQNDTAQCLLTSVTIMINLKSGRKA